MAPSFLRSAMVTSAPSSKAVMKMWSCHTTGEEWPGGTAVFHSRFSDGPNAIGGRLSSATPEPLGPRNRAHSTDDRAPKGTVSTTTNPSVAKTFMGCIMRFPAPGHKRLSRHRWHPIWLERRSGEMLMVDVEGRTQKEPEGL